MNISYACFECGAEIDLSDRAADELPRAMTEWARNHKRSVHNQPGDNEQTTADPHLIAPPASADGH
jgi:hypothetical protein